MIRHPVFSSALFSLFFVFLIPNAYAGKVVKVKDKKVYIIFDSNEGGTFAEGDNFTLTDANGKKKGLVQIKRVKGLKAIGQLRKGKADKGYGTIFRSAGKGSTGELSDHESASTSTKMGPAKTRWGAAFSYSAASQDVDQGDTISAESGSSMGIKGVYDYPLLNTVVLRALAGVELFSVSGKGVPLASSAEATVGTDITYLSIDGAAKWDFLHLGSSMSLHASAGAGFLYPMTKSSDVIVEDSIEMVVVGEFGAGVDWKWGKWIVPIDAVYYYFPDGADVKTSMFGVRVGILF